MWILVVVLVSGPTQYSYAESIPYLDVERCWIDAYNTYQTLMTTRPNDKANVIAFCTEVPTGI